MAGTPDARVSKKVMETAIIQHNLTVQVASHAVKIIALEDQELLSIILMIVATTPRHTNTTSALAKDLKQLPKEL